MKLQVILLLAIIVFVLLESIVIRFQKSCIYHAKKYYNGWESLALMSFPHLQIIEHQHGKVLYWPHQINDAPERVWILFGGNAMTGMDWLYYLEEQHMAEPNCGYLLVDYPGYGACRGSPSFDSIRKSNLDVFKTTRRKLSLKKRQSYGVLGFSLGCATALQFINDLDRSIQIDNVILLCPFTTMKEVVRDHTHWICEFLVTEKWDNREGLKRLVERRPGINISVIDAENDALIPPKMVNELCYPYDVRRVTINNADHNEALSKGIQKLCYEMTRSMQPPDDQLGFWDEVSESSYSGADIMT